MPKHKHEPTYIMEGGVVIGFIVDDCDDTCRPKSVPKPEWTALELETAHNKAVKLLAHAYAWIHEPNNKEFCKHGYCRCEVARHLSDKYELPWKQLTSDARKASMKERDQT